MGKSTEHLVNAVLVVTALVVAIGVARVALFGVPGAAPVLDRSPERLESWEEAAIIGHSIAGPADADVTITMLGDLECPACGAFFPILEDAADRWSPSVRAIYVSVPLEYHRFGRPAAQAAECAAQVGVLSDWLRLVYLKQDSLGLKTWESYGTEVGMTNSARVRDCALAPDTFSRIHAARDFAERIEFTEVPTVLVNEWRLGKPPSPEELNEAIRLVMSGEDVPDAR